MTKDEWKEAAVGGGEVWDREGVLEGVLVRRKSKVGPNESMLYTVRVKDGEVGVWGSTVLDTKFEEVPDGSKIKLESLGKVKSEKTGRSYMDFKLLYVPPTEEYQEAMPEQMPPDWLKDIPNDEPE